MEEGVKEDERYTHRGVWAGKARRGVLDITSSSNAVTALLENADDVSNARHPGTPT